MATINEQFIQVKTKANFESRLSAGDVKDTSIAFIEDTNEIWAKGHYYPCPYTKEELTNLFNNKVDKESGKSLVLDSLITKLSGLKTQQEIDSAINAKQDTLVSGTNIKTINNESLLGSGNITIANSSTDWDSIENKPQWIQNDGVNWSDINEIPSTVVTSVNITGSGNAVVNASFSSNTLTLSKGTISSGQTYGPATTTTLGLVSVPSSGGLSVNAGVLSVNSSWLTTQVENIFNNNITVSWDDIQDIPKLITSVGFDSVQTPNGYNLAVNVNGTPYTENLVFKTINNNSIVGSGNITIESESYELPTATMSTLGGVRLGTSSSPTGNVYPIGNLTNRLNVGIPTVSTSTNGIMSSTDKSRLDQLWNGSSSSLPYVKKAGDTMSGTLNNTSVTPLQFSGAEWQFLKGTRALYFRTNQAGTRPSGGDPAALTFNCTQNNIVQVQLAEDALVAKYNYDGTKAVSVAGTLTVSGNITAPAFYESSDRNLKENIKDIKQENKYLIDSVNLKQFNFKNDDALRFGVIAQEVEVAGLNFLVSEDTNGNKAVDYISLLILKIASLEDKIKKLEYNNLSYGQENC